MQFNLSRIMRSAFLVVGCFAIVHCWRNTSGIKLNIKSTQNTAFGNRGRSSIEIGKGFGAKETSLISTTATTPEEQTYQVSRSPPVRDSKHVLNLTVGLVLPFKQFGTRDYVKSITSTLSALKKKQFKLNHVIEMFIMTPTPTRHSGFLITWKPKEIEDKEVLVNFDFGYRIEGDKNQKIRWNHYSTVTRSTDHGYKLHSLKENTLYKIFIRQSTPKMATLNHELLMKTNKKTTSKPAKPDFLYKYFEELDEEHCFHNIKIQWLPCGKEGNCSDKEAGTHFAVKLRAIDRRGEQRSEVYFYGHTYLNYLTPGILYEAVVISINNNLETESDPQEIFTEPKILSSLCNRFLPMNVSSILYLMNYEKYGRSTASAQYFLQLAGYLGIPVIAWNADNSGLERRASQSNLQLQLAPSLEHQTAAMLSILERYKWHQFSVVTSQIAGHDDFVQAVRERIVEMQDRFKFTLLNAVLVTNASDLIELVNSESRVMLLYATSDEANGILKAADEYKIIGENYVWVVTQSVIENLRTSHQFPIGMLGVHFDTSGVSLVNEISTAIKVFANGVENYLNDPRNANESLNTQLSCEGQGDSRWKNGERFYKHLRNVSIEGDNNKPRLEFTADGVLKATELKIMNLRRGDNKQLVWEEIGVWKSWEKEGLDIKDIVWPGNSHTPPQGVPEKFHLKITFLEEAPYISLTPPDPVSGKCNVNRGVLCRVAKEADMSQIDISQAYRNETFYQCCSGFCIDLLSRLAEELAFTYELVRVEDGRWGTLQHGKWNGLIADLVNRKTEMVLTALMINSDRESVVDFSIPFMETGTSIIVAKRTGIISPTAFLEPFDTASWFLVGVVAIHAATFTIFLFEWMSPSGFNMKTKSPTPTYRFSILRSYWLVWAVLFQAAVHVDCPRGLTSRFMTNIWAMFAVVFLAIYTANLAAFMITREEFHEFTGLDDPRLQKPLTHKPMIRFGSVPFSHTDSTIQKYFKEMHAYMSHYNKSTVKDGVDSVINRELDAFIYDGTVLDYMAEQDEGCRLLTVGTWYAKTGYGLAFTRKSKYLQMFNRKLLEFRENGDLERLRRYWMTGTCLPGKDSGNKSSDPLAMEQFLSAFVLLMFGILLAFTLLGFENGYFKYAKKRMYKKSKKPCCCGCCSLISVSMGKILESEFEEYQTQIRKNNSFSCRNKGCAFYVQELEKYLDKSQLRIRYLEMELNRNNIKIPPYSFLRDVRKRHDMTRIKSTTEYLGNFHATPRKKRTEIAEIETVL